jgi:hypothetical protein
VKIEMMKMNMRMMTKNVPHQMRDAREEIVTHEEAHEHKVIY